MGVMGGHNGKGVVGLLRVYRVLYEYLARPVIFRQSAQGAHERLLRLLQWADGLPWMESALAAVAARTFAGRSTAVGGAVLSHPLILAAGLVKGHGFASEAEAMQAVRDGVNIIPGWRSVPRLAGLVEFGSFTRWPRPGNVGTVVWRHAASRSTQNRVGLRNPGATAAAAFLARHSQALPPQFGINVAVSPGVEDPAQERQEVVEAIAAFVAAGVYPTWFTVNLSCPNTEDDPGAYQTEERARALCRAAMGYLQQAVEGTGRALPLWVKVGPTLADEQYQALMGVFHEVGVGAVIATNTMPEPAPGQPATLAGVGGGRLHQRALDVVALLMQEKRERGYAPDVIGCGGVLDGRSCCDFFEMGVPAVQYWSALIYRGPLAAALMAQEAFRACGGQHG